MLDCGFSSARRPTLSPQTLRSYVNIVVYKTAFYTFYLPIACAMLLAGITDKKLFAKVGADASGPHGLLHTLCRANASVFNRAPPPDMG